MPQKENADSQLFSPTQKRLLGDATNRCSPRLKKLREEQGAGGMKRCLSAAIRHFVDNTCLLFALTLHEAETLHSLACRFSSPTDDLLSPTSRTLKSKKRKAER